LRKGLQRRIVSSSASGSATIFDSGGPAGGCLLNIKYALRVKIRIAFFLFLIAKMARLFTQHTTEMQRAIEAGELVTHET
jgi:hypothetical protein